MSVQHVDDFDLVQQELLESFVEDILDGSKGGASAFLATRVAIFISTVGAHSASR